jgi:3',5'-cyclic AMP phosphodiesterase CpdA
MLRIVQLSDTHISRRGGVIASNFARIAAFVNDQLRPDLIIHTGDVVAASPDSVDDRQAARRLLASLDASVHVVPGNHDVGEPGARPWMGVSVTSARVAAHREAFGHDAFLVLHDGWAVLSANSELMGSGLREEEEQWEWLEHSLARMRTREVVLFLHKPLWLPRRGPSAAALSVPASARERLMALPGADRIRAVGSGHLHHYRRRRNRAPTEVWAPSTAFIGQPGVQPEDLDQLGVVEWHLGDGRADAWFRAPTGLEELEGHEIPELVATIAELEPAGYPVASASNSIRLPHGSSV